MTDTTSMSARDSIAGSASLFAELLDGRQEEAVPPPSDTILYCAHLAIFMQSTGVFRTIQLEIPTFHSIYAQVQLGILALKSTNQPELLLQLYEYM